MHQGKPPNVVGGLLWLLLSCNTLGTSPFVLLQSLTPIYLSNPLYRIALSLCISTLSTEPFARLGRETTLTREGVNTTIKKREKYRDRLKDMKQ